MYSVGGYADFFLKDSCKIIHVFDSYIVGNILNLNIGVKQFQRGVDPAAVDVVRQSHSHLPAEQGGEVTGVDAEHL